MTTTAPAPSSVVKVWGAVSNPWYSITVTEGATDAELAQLVELAVNTFTLLAERLAVTRVQGSSSRGTGDLVPGTGDLA